MLLPSLFLFNEMPVVEIKPDPFDEAKKLMKEISSINQATAQGLSALQEKRDLLQCQLQEQAMAIEAMNEFFGPQQPVKEVA